MESSPLLLFSCSYPSPLLSFSSAQNQKAPEEGYPPSSLMSPLYILCFSLPHFLLVFFHLLLFQQTPPTQKKKKCSLCLFFHPNREPRWTSTMTLKKSTKKKMRISFAHGSLKNSHPKNLMQENYPIAS